jgi:hypothetical protein
MATKKASPKQEPLLNAVARKLGHAAGTLTKVTQEFTENLSELPETVTAKMQQIANAATPAGHTRTRPRHAKKRNRRAASATAVKKALVKSSGKGKSRGSKSSRSSAKPRARHK